MASNGTPPGCGANLDSVYFNLCDLGAAWGVVLEALAAAGVVFSFVLLISLLASLPFIQNPNHRSSVALQASFLFCTMGLFGLTFAFVVGKDFSTCASRRFLFGVLFGGCFSCLLMQCVRLNVLVRRNSGPRTWILCLGALGLWLVEVVINTEWLIITVVRHPQGPLNATVEAPRAVAVPCNIANQDFVMALIYVMALALAVVLGSLTIMGGKYSEWKKEGALILVITLLSVAVWVAWIVMYVYGNGQVKKPTWDDPTLAIALVANAWVFVIFYVIPLICCLNSSTGGEEESVDNGYTNRGVGYETVLKQQSAQNAYMENKAFSMDESSNGNKLVSPYSNYTGQMRASVYQPTELALISKPAGNASLQQQWDQNFDRILPRASTGSTAHSGSRTPSPHPHGRTPTNTHR